MVDDGSPEPVTITNEDWPFHIKLIRQDNGGLSSARNAGIAESSGRYIKFLDADDALLPNCIASQVACMGGRDDIISVIGFIIKNEENGQCETT